MKLSQIMPQNQWAWVHEYCYSNKVNPVLIAAIGWHETHWGRLGMGRYGYHMGISCWVRNDAQYQHDLAIGQVDQETYTKVSGGHLYCSRSLKGMQNQVKWAVEHIKGKVPYTIGYPNVLYIAEKIWIPGNPKAWADSVWSIYKNMEIDLPSTYVPSEPETIPTSDNELPSASGIILSIASHLEEIVKLLRNWRL